MQKRENKKRFSFSIRICDVSTFQSTFDVRHNSTFQSRYKIAAYLIVHLSSFLWNIRKGKNELILVIVSQTFPLILILPVKIYMKKGVLLLTMGVENSICKERSVRRR